MASPIVFDKTLAASSATKICASQSGTANVSLLLNGSAGCYLSTTSSSSAAAGKAFISLASTAGLVVGQTVSDSTATGALSNITKITAVNSVGIGIWPPVAGTVGNGDTIVLSGGYATIDAATSTNSAIGRRVLITSAGNDAALIWTVIGTDSTGATITDSFAGSASTSYSNLDFVTVTSVVPSGNTASTVTVGTNGVGSSPWLVTNWDATSLISLGFAVELVSGSVNFTVQHTYDDPNNLVGGATFPIAFNHSVVTSQNATIDGSYQSPVAAVRILINSGTGEIRFRVLQSSIG